jgi:hypothetical protein
MVGQGSSPLGSHENLRFSWKYDSVLVTAGQEDVAR